MSGIKGMNKGHIVKQETRDKIRNKLLNSGKGYSITQGYKVWHKAGNYEREQRLIMEKYLGRKLKFDEHIHHKDRNRLNNNIDNLVLLTNSEHLKLHRREKHLKHYNLDWLEKQLKIRTQRDIARECNVSEVAIGNFIDRYLRHPECKTWAEYYKIRKVNER